MGPVENGIIHGAPLFCWRRECVVTTETAKGGAGTEKPQCGLAREGEKRFHCVSRLAAGPATGKTTRRRATALLYPVGKGGKRMS